MSNAVIGPFISPTRPAGSQNIPPIGIGTGPGSRKLDLSAVKTAILQAIELGYRHLQTAVSSFLEYQAVGEAIVEALERGLINSREELFITCYLPYHDAGPDFVVQNLRKFLEKMHLAYVDLCLVQQAEEDEPERSNDDNPFTDLMFVWEAMEKCQKLGLTKSIGVCNFSLKKLQNMLKFAKVPPSINQVGMHRFLKEKELREFCLANNISIIACSTIGGEEKHSDFTQFMELEALQKTAKDRTKTADQVVSRWAHEQGASLLLESLSKEHMLEILNILEWSSSQDD
ncbi:Non-functional NADPH-dependent codeinone reductase 2 [Sesamum angolense]|uniref:Non-functional NADPH-dependent codeinone reductase 2 n=1 Tax=Sesamum angolense TaxID=2727404 RepID=A0AAE1WZU5_9LAMI|nr:Non-functional NADPH-dependent codeinone reductase 2 [Sesamum angolense]